MIEFADLVCVNKRKARLYNCQRFYGIKDGLNAGPSLDSVAMQDAESVKPVVWSGRAGFMRERQGGRSKGKCRPDLEAIVRPLGKNVDVCKALGSGLGQNGSTARKGLQDHKSASRVVVDRFSTAVGISDEAQQNLTACHLGIPRKRVQVARRRSSPELRIDVAAIAIVASVITPSRVCVESEGTVLEGFTTRFIDQAHVVSLSCLIIQEKISR